MEQGSKKKPLALLALVLGCALVFGLTRPQERAVAAGAVLDLPVQRSAAAAQTEVTGRRLVPMGRAVGIKLFSNGVLVVGLSDLETEAGAVGPGKSCGLRAGDVITHINGHEVDTIEQVQDILKKEGAQPLTLQASREKKSMQLSAQPVKNEKGEYQLGVWLRDSMAGIGTMTFYDPESGTFAALGHGINDVDTSVLMPMESGSIMYAAVSDVKKGAVGDPGELHGNFDVNRDMGTLRSNTNTGIYGALTDQTLVGAGQPMEVAARDEVHTGSATILSNVDGETVREYQVEITKVYGPSAGETRNLALRVTDPELLAKTGGIVQGMSGSPIIQDGKLVGAVTHVLVNDPTKGYGIFIENMLNAAE